ncbi:MAG: M48 family metalloprotease [Gammaproteobacteria bacterium]|nr:M48 family metalloprotease [Gammaproteobacteria bacterium]
MKQNLKSSLNILLAIIPLLSGCATEKLFGLPIITFDEEAEVEQGANKHQRIVEQIGTYNDAKLSAHISVIGEKLAAASDRPALKWHFTLIDSNIPNAFATQGGYVYITRGMLALLQSDDELAAVLSHEIAHICSRDSLRAQRVGNMMELGVLGSMVVAPALILFPQLAAAPAGASMAAFSRKDELNADQHGIVYLQKAGYSPEAMQAVMEVLAIMEAYERDRLKTSGRDASSQWWHRVYASHPSTEKREQNLVNAAGPSNSSASKNLQPQFLALLNGLEFGAAKYEGIPYGEKRYFTQWKLAMKIPDGWRVGINEKYNLMRVMRPEAKAYIQIERSAAIDVAHPCDFLAKLEAPWQISGSNSINHQDLPSCTGMARKTTKTLFNSHEQIFRTAVLAENKSEGKGYVIRGYARDKLFEENDLIFLSIIESVEPVLAPNKQPKPLTLHIRRATAEDSFASIARNLPHADKNTESQLRLLNRRYPDGEITAGDFIKVIE